MNVRNPYIFLVYVRHLRATIDITLACMLYSICAIYSDWPHENICAMYNAQALVSSCTLKARENFFQALHMGILVLCGISIRFTMSSTNDAESGEERDVRIQQMRELIRDKRVAE